MGKGTFWVVAVTLFLVILIAVSFIEAALGTPMWLNVVFGILWGYLYGYFGAKFYYERFGFSRKL